jgi:hypothetical protein
MFYYIPHSDMNAMHYVQLMYLQVFQFSEMFHYTYHGNMDAPQCVNADALSDVPVPGIFYHT